MTRIKKCGVAKDRRGVVRRAIGVRCQVVRERDFRLVGDSTLDVSTNGMRVEALREVLTGEPLIVSFKLPGGSHWVDTEATVVRVVHGRRPEDRGRALGIRFVGLDAVSRDAIARAFRGVPPPVPARRRI